MLIFYLTIAPSIFISFAMSPFYINTNAPGISYFSFNIFISTYASMWRNNLYYAELVIYDASVTYKAFAEIYF